MSDGWEIVYYTVRPPELQETDVMLLVTIPGEDEKTIARVLDLKELQEGSVGVLEVWPEKVVLFYKDQIPRCIISSGTGSCFTHEIEGEMFSWMSFRVRHSDGRNTIARLWTSATDKDGFIMCSVSPYNITIWDWNNLKKRNWMEQIIKISSVSKFKPKKPIQTLEIRRKDTTLSCVINASYKISWSIGADIIDLNPSIFSKTYSRVVEVWEDEV
jgi:hypothetical protein